MNPDTGEIKISMSLKSWDDIMEEGYKVQLKKNKLKDLIPKSKQKRIKWWKQQPKRR